MGWAQIGSSSEVKAWLRHLQTGANQLANHVSDGKASIYNVGDPGSIPGSGRSAGEGNSNPLQYYCLENPMDRGAW